MSPEELKSALLDSFWGTERGLTASADTRAEINELVVQLEASNDCDNVTEARSARCASRPMPALVACMCVRFEPLLFP